MLVRKRLPPRTCSASIAWEASKAATLISAGSAEANLITICPGANSLSTGTPALGTPSPALAGVLPKLPVEKSTAINTIKMLKRRMLIHRLLYQLT
jgi:hypothetical protein